MRDKKQTEHSDNFNLLTRLESFQTMVQRRETQADTLSWGNRVKFRGKEDSKTQNKFPEKGNAWRENERSPTEGPLKYLSNNWSAVHAKKPIELERGTIEKF